MCLLILWPFLWQTEIEIGLAYIYNIDKSQWIITNLIDVYDIFKNFVVSCKPIFSKPGGMSGKLMS